MKTNNTELSIYILNTCLLFSASIPVSSSIINELEPNNPTPSFVTSAYNIDSYFSSEFNADIGDIEGINISQNSSHVSIKGTGDGTFDYYSFTVSEPGLTGVFDIDYGVLIEQYGDNYGYTLGLWNDKGFTLAANRFSDITMGAGGSNTINDPFIQYDFVDTGTYIIGLAAGLSSTNNLLGFTRLPVKESDTYTLQIALGTGFSPTPPLNPVPIPASIYLFITGILSLSILKRLPKHIDS